MTTPNTPQQSPAAPAAASTPTTEVSGSGLIKSYDERAAEAFGSENSEGSSPEQPQGTPAAPPTDEAARREQRRKEIAQWKAQEAARLEAQSRYRQGEEAQRRAERLQQERDELAKQAASRIDPSSLDEAGFFALAERLQVTPKKLGEWIQQRATHPEVIAAQYAEKAVDPKLSALEAKIAEQNALLQQINQERMTERQTQEAYARGQSMLDFAQQSAAQAPLAAAFLREHGADEFLTVANSEFANVPKGPGWEQHVLDAIEDKLSQLGRIFQQPQGGTQQPRQAPPTPHRGAAQPMTTVSNTLAQSRASVVDGETDWAALPYEERAARLFGS